MKALSLILNIIPSQQFFINKKNVNFASGKFIIRTANLIYMKKLFLFVMVALLLSACSNSGSKSTTDQGAQNEIVITNDLENAKGVIPSWYNEKTVVNMKDPLAHSGSYACVTNDTIEFSYSYSELFKNIRNGVPKMATLSGWIYTTVANPEISIICNINENKNRYQWKVYPLEKEISETGKWIEFNSSFYFDKPLNPEQEVSFVAWNLSKKTVYLDDFKITFMY